MSNAVVSDILISSLNPWMVILLPLLAIYCKYRFDKLGHSTKCFETVAPHLNDPALFSKSEFFIETLFKLYTGHEFSARHLRFILSRQGPSMHFSHFIRAETYLRFDTVGDSYVWNKSISLKVHKMGIGLVLFLGTALYFGALVMLGFHVSDSKVFLVFMGSMLTWLWACWLAAPIWSAEHLIANIRNYSLYPKHEQFYEGIVPDNSARSSRIQYKLVRAQ